MTRKFLCDRFPCTVARITSRQPVREILDNIIGKLKSMANMLGFFIGDGEPPEYQIKLISQHTIRILGIVVPDYIIYMLCPWNRPVPEN